MAAARYPDDDWSVRTRSSGCAEASGLLLRKAAMASTGSINVAFASGAGRFNEAAVFAMAGSDGIVAARPDTTSAAMRPPANAKRQSGDRAPSSTAGPTPACRVSERRAAWRTTVTATRVMKSSGATTSLRPGREEVTA